MKTSDYQKAEIHFIKDKCSLDRAEQLIKILEPGRNHVTYFFFKVN